MDASQAADHGYWGYLIKPDKSASPQLEQLCLGLAKVIPTLEPGPNDELTPQRLAAFYRAVDGNYDSLFLRTTEGGLSFMYQTLGCFHSLQPTASPFDQPRVPCLTPHGFARWQTIQILLCPEENVGFMQKAVQKWNVPMPNGGTFPKYIPQSSFPAKPDEEMERWHKMVTGQLNQKNYMHRLKNSPHQSPHIEPTDRRDGYFAGASLRRPTRHSRSSSRDDSDRRAASYHRRSSVPDFPSPPQDRGIRFETRPTTGGHQTRSHSAQRPPHPPSRQRSHTASGNSSSPPNKNSPAKSRRTIDPNDPAARRSSAHASFQYRSPARTPSTVDEDTGSEASSETSHVGRRHRRSDEDRKTRPSSLWVPSFMRSHKRRHSSDASYRANAVKDSAQRSDHRQPQAIKAPPPAAYRGGAPQWRDTDWGSDAATATPPQTYAQLDPRGPAIRYPDQASFEPLTRESSSGSGTDQRYRSSDWERGGAHRRGGAPLRVGTLTGVQGRRYPTSDPMSPIDRQRSHAPPSRGGVAALG
ncbi:uncharacterized protein PV06_10375 [Exophiala oligosperma]|uniref:DUF7514 domain-containing protein n=2 Tax=Chaetothyriales TaxID=34395 RepID=A0A0D2AAD1_9EURO|nr:uncharacterized protein PV06_10375 [Exophiala oligosperma]KAJ9646880.1 hypothetical protein H2204_000572 [Knufia peltigerae]KIW37326.1 hypothetical protein PV06_10375 [Exophiala oligosperma]